jgi:hypothetical protein
MFMFSEPIVRIWAPFVGIIVFNIFLIIVVAIIAMFEKRYIKPYTENIDPELPETKASRKWGDTLEDDGFDHFKTTKDNRGGQYKLRYDFYCTPEGDRIAIVACGTLIKIPFQVTILTTRFDDESWIRTVSHQNGSEFDLSGLSTEVVVENSISNLLDRHDERVEFAVSDEGKKVVPYNIENPLLDYCGDLIHRTELLESKGYARFRDDERSYWTYTFRGAVKLSIRSIFTAFRRSFKRD